MDMRDIKEFLKDAFKYIVIIVVVLITFIYIVSLQQVIGPSMQQTLYKNDIVILNKIKYRFFPVQRFEIVSLEYDDTKYLIKRVIGLPGEHIEYKNNILYIDGKEIKEPFLKNATTEDFSLEDLGYDVIPDDMYLVLGDNRNNSMDSREIGLIKKQAIIGQAIVRIWPLNGFKIIK